MKGFIELQYVFPLIFVLMSYNYFLLLMDKSFSLEVYYKYLFYSLDLFITTLLNSLFIKDAWKIILFNLRYGKKDNIWNKKNHSNSCS